VKLEAAAGQPVDVTDDDGSLSEAVVVSAAGCGLVLSPGGPLYESGKLLHREAGPGSRFRLPWFYATSAAGISVAYARDGGKETPHRNWRRVVWRTWRWPSLPYSF